MFRLSVTIEIGRTGQDEPQTRELQILSRESWRRVKALVRKRDDAICKYCGRFAPDGEPDHVVPLSRGGLDALDNLAWACAACNGSKGSKTLQEWEGAKQSAPALGTLPYTVEELADMTDDEQAEVWRRYPDPNAPPMRVLQEPTPEVAGWIDDVEKQVELGALTDYGEGEVISENEGGGNGVANGHGAGEQ